MDLLSGSSFQADIEYSDEPRLNRTKNMQTDAICKCKVHQNDGIS